MSKLFLSSQENDLRNNWRRGCELAAQDRESEHDPRPVVKLFNPCGAATWLLTELFTEDGVDMAFGLCDLGFGTPELGYVSIDELADIRVMGGLLGIERDRHFIADKTLSEYAAEAREIGRINV